jgi:uroporphyrinogen-III decarboxylase
MNKKQLYKDLLEGKKEKERVFFCPILMHFAARFNNTTYGKFASDYKVLVESNIRSMEYFDTDMVSLISDPYRETSAFGANIEFIDEGVPRCLDHVVKTIDDVRDLNRPDVYKNDRTLQCPDGQMHVNRKGFRKSPDRGWL